MALARQRDVDKPLRRAPARLEACRPPDLQIQGVATSRAIAHRRECARETRPRAARSAPSKGSETPPFCAVTGLRPAVRAYAPTKARHPPTPFGALDEPSERRKATTEVTTPRRKLTIKPSLAPTLPPVDLKARPGGPSATPRGGARPVDSARFECARDDWFPLIYFRRSKNRWDEPRPDCPYEEIRRKRG